MKRSERQYILAGNYQILDRFIARQQRAQELLQRAADRLQDYCNDANPSGLNDSLAQEIEAFLNAQDSA